MKRLLQLRNKKYQKGGFTLVELIVVLVILAILAALLVPALTGYIDKAKEKQVIAETRSLLTAVQTEASELYASSDWNHLSSPSMLADKKGTTAYDNVFSSDTLKEHYKTIVELSEVPSLQNGGKGQFFAIVNLQGRFTVSSMMLEMDILVCIFKRLMNISLSNLLKITSIFLHMTDRSSYLL